MGDARKRAIRARMALTGETYSTARMHVMNDRNEGNTRPLQEDDLDTCAVCHREASRWAEDATGRAYGSCSREHSGIIATWRGRPSPGQES